jgi:prepilin-type N-terminal cleavage/methylation domain-containing protein
MKQEKLQLVNEGSLTTEHASGVRGKSCAGFSLVEMLLASALFALLLTALIGAFFYGQESAMLSGNRMRAIMYAEEGLEAVRNIRDQDFSHLVDGTYGLDKSSGQWELVEGEDFHDMFTRHVEVVVTGGEWADVYSVVEWQQNAQRSGSVTLTTRLTAWRE